MAWEAGLVLVASLLLGSNGKSAGPSKRCMPLHCSVWVPAALVVPFGTDPVIKQCLHVDGEGVVDAQDCG